MDTCKKDITRFTFDCPTALHHSVKMKAVASKKSVKDYLVQLIIKDVSEDSSSFTKQIPSFLEKHKELMEGLAKR